MPCEKCKYLRIKNGKKFCLIFRDVTNPKSDCKPPKK